MYLSFQLFVLRWHRVSVLQNNAKSIRRSVGNFDDGRILDRRLLVVGVELLVKRFRRSRQNQRVGAKRFLLILNVKLRTVRKLRTVETAIHDERLPFQQEIVHQISIPPRADAVCEFGGLACHAP